MAKTRAEKDQEIQELTEQLSKNEVFYLADTSELNVENTNALRKKCYEQNVNMRVVKNTLLRKAMEQVEEKDLSELYDSLEGPTSIMFSEIGNAPAKIIQDFRKQHQKPLLKAAFIEEQVFLGDENLKDLAALKTKEELVGDLVGLLQSPMQNLLSALQSGEDKIGGLVKALQDRGEGEEKAEDQES